MEDVAIVLTIETIDYCLHFLFSEETLKNLNVALYIYRTNGK